MSSKEVFDYLMLIGCCKYCAVRFLNNEIIDFTKLDDFFKEKGFSSALTDDETREVKKCKPNPCIVCLGLLQENVMDDVIDKLVVSDVEKYDSKVFTCSISIPSASMVREHTLRLCMRQKFPEYYTGDVEEIPLNKAWKSIIKTKLSQKLQKTFENSDTCSFSINIVMDYEYNNFEVSVLKPLILKKGDLNSRKFMTSLLIQVTSDKFLKLVKCPPSFPSSGLTLKSIECKHSSVFMAGRYCKYSRELSQTPWVIDGVKMMESSVEEIIFEPILQTFHIRKENLKFSSSGREDCDVRCLGKGRPFYIEFLDPKITAFTNHQFRDLQAKINKSKLIQVRDLQMVHKSEVSKIKEGEQLKSKEYIALCQTKVEVTQDHIDKINKCGELELKQKTPIRVLHRRPLVVRNRKIFKITGSLIPGKSNLFELRVITEAGTYVKEFVHGDFGRTKPNLEDIMEIPVDIIALDVVSINLDWPKEVNYDSPDFPCF